MSSRSNLKWSTFGLCALALSLQACGSSTGSSGYGTVPARILSTGGDYQSATPGTQLTLPLMVQVVDSAQRPVPNVPVKWDVSIGSADVSPPTARTDVGGKVAANVVVNSSGTIVIRAVVTSDSAIGVSFTAFGTGNGIKPPLNTPNLTVEVGDNYFSPVTVRITVGQTVTWKWVGANRHDVTFDDTTITNPGILGTSGGLGHTWSWTFKRAGTFPYHCTFHGNGGTIVVGQ